MIKILIVDDSRVETQLFRHFLESEPDMEVIACASNGAEAVEMARRYSPDLITMDLEMPVMDGHTATRLIMSQCPVPIVVISAKLNDPSVDMTWLALEAGAVSVLAKPVNEGQSALVNFRKQLVDMVRSMAEIKVVKRRFNQAGTVKIKENSVSPDQKQRHFEIIAIGTSIGGPEVLKKLIAELPDSFPVPIVIVQHMTKGFMQGFTQWLDASVSLTVKNVHDGEKLKKGFIYFAPDDFHLTIMHKGKDLTASLQKGEPVSGFCPSITVLMQSIAKTCGKNALGVLLTGMGSDGAEGLLTLKQAGGHTIIQDEKSCVVFGMANIANSMGAVDRTVEMDKMADYLIKMTQKS